jgi:hypothetical protein
MANTFSYYVAAYVVAGIILGGYVVSLAVRARRLPPAGQSPPAER